MTNATTFVVKSARKFSHYKFIARASSNLLTVNIEIVIPISSYRDVFDEISEASIAPVRLQMRECKGEVHGFISPTELNIINAKSIDAVD